MFPDYTATWPFWGPEGYVGDPRTELGITPALLTAISSWVENWEILCPAETGWLSAQYQDEWISRGNELFELLTEELPNGITVQPEFRKAFPH